jgi:hypothetical protein
MIRDDPRAETDGAGSRRGAVKVADTGLPPRPRGQFPVRLRNGDRNAGGAPVQTGAKVKKTLKLEFRARFLLL